MIAGKSVLAVIPARGGSKGVPRKNIRELAGKPLIAWTIEEAKKSKYIDKLIVSSEDDEIINISKSYGAEVPFVRPRSLTEDETPGIEVILHAIEKCPGFLYVLMLQPTSPLRRVRHIDRFIEQFKDEAVKCSVSVTLSGKHPFWMFTMKEDRTLIPFCKGAIPTNRQNLPLSYSLNGALYMADNQWLKRERSFLTEETRGFYMAPEYSIDIDTELDFIFCDMLIKRYI